MPRRSPIRMAASARGARRRRARVSVRRDHSSRPLAPSDDDRAAAAGSTATISVRRVRSRLGALARFRVRMGLLAGARSSSRIAYPEHGAMTPDRPYLSVIVPVKNGHNVLPRMLGMLSRASCRAKPGSSSSSTTAARDDSPAIASGYADLVIRLPGRSRGPGYARNRGVERARGECVVFLDADVVVRPDTLSRIAATMTTRSDVDAVFGAYCDEPAAAGMVSKYRNLLHHYTHDSGTGRGADASGRAAAACDEPCSSQSACTTNGASRVRRSRTSSWDIASRRTGIASSCSPTSRSRISSGGRSRHAEGGLHGSRRSVGAAPRRAACAARAGGGEDQESEPKSKEKSNTFFVCLGLLLLVLAIAAEGSSARDQRSARSVACRRAARPAASTGSSSESADCAFAIAASCCT